MLNRKELNERLDSNPFLVMSDVLYQALFEDIITLKIRPGEKLSESKIADALQISRTPVRNALMRLTEDNLVSRKDGKASVVSPMRKEESRSLFEARIAIEGYAAYLAAQRIDHEQLENLRDLLLQYKSLCVDFDSNKFAKCDHEFHSMIVSIAGNEHISQMYSKIEKGILHYRYCLNNEIGGKLLKPIIKNSANTHEAIYNAMKMRFADAARSEVERDISGMLDVFSEWR